MGVKKLNIRKQVIGENALYGCVWLGVFLVPFMNAGMMSESIRPDMILIAWFKIIPFYLLFVVNNFLLFRYLHRKYLYWVYYIVATVLIVGIFSLLEWYEQSDIIIAFDISFGAAGEVIKGEHVSLSVFPWWGNMLAAAAMLAANNLIYTFYRTMQKEEDSERLQRQNVQAEMYYLKHQINPHFLMNTLNNIHALIDLDMESAKRTVIHLSDMMRHVVYGTSDDAISLKQDIEFIKNYIELMRIRYTEDVDIIFSYPEGVSGRIKLPPLILIVFVENAFKHGVSYNHNSFIRIEVDCTEEGIVANFENSYFPQPGVHKQGIGLENVRKRLDLIYGEAYSLVVNDKEEGKYSITLKIPYIDDKVHSNR